MTRRALAVCALTAVLVACDGLPGRPRRADRPVRPSDVMDFATLYGESCAGCHGDDNAPGAAVSLVDPVYLALVDAGTLRRVTADGVPGTAMPGFAQSAGGSLTDAQIDVVVRELHGRRVDVGKGTPPPYAAPPGDAGRGDRVYATYCASCHGPTGKGGARGGSIVDPSYLALVSDQGLRTTVLVGRRGLMPSWFGDGTAPAMTAGELADVVAWMVAKRAAFPGRPNASVEPGDG